MSVGWESVFRQFHKTVVQNGHKYQSVYELPLTFQKPLNNGASVGSTDFVRSSEGIAPICHVELGAGTKGKALDVLVHMF